PPHRPHPPAPLACRPPAPAPPAIPPPALLRNPPPATPTNRLLAMLALPWSMSHNRVGLLGHRQTVAHVTRLPSTLFLARRSPTGPLMPQAIARRRLATSMAVFRQPPFQFGHSPLQPLNLVSQGGIFRHIPQQLPDLLTQHGVLRLQLGDTF